MSNLAATPNEYYVLVDTTLETPRQDGYYSVRSFNNSRPSLVQFNEHEFINGAWEWVPYWTITHWLKLLENVVVIHTNTLKLKTIK